ncbi:DUF4115 domain-containing protein [Pleurocapsales cyanobacterium LEGE 10410]|nr:DUF4115 domain-containing protein [Pleurocapsales cyanobacterium LEGE 10410]
MTKNNNNLNLFTDQQQLKELGANLQRVRVAKNIPLEQVADNTRISKRLLKAIEAGDLEELPELFYVQALIQKYAREIGAEIEFKANSASDVETSTNIFRPDKRKYWFNFQLRSRHLYALYILLVIISVKGISTLVERPVIINQAPLENSDIDSKVAQSVPAPQITQPKAAPQFVSQSSNSEAVTVGINLQERCWLKVMVDGRTAFEGILPQGTQRQWTGKQQVTIRAGNAGGVVISFNNEQQKVLGAPGQVEEITYTVN